MKILLPDPGKYPMGSDIHATLSFIPYLNYLKKRIEDPTQQFADFYRQVIDRFEGCPEMLQPLENLNLIEKNEALFQLVASTLFPLSRDADLQYYSLGTPYKFQVFFYSKSYSDYFSPDENGYVNFPPERPFEHLQYEYMLMAYRMVFRKFYQVEISVPERKTNRWVDKLTGLHRYSRIHIDESFIDVQIMDDLPLFPRNCIDAGTGKILDIDSLQQKLPLSIFRFEGFIIRRSIVDVTVEECIKEVKNALIEIQSNNPEPGYEKVRSAIETLLGLKNVAVSLSPFLKLNERYVYYHPYSGRSVLLGGLDQLNQKEEAYNQMAILLNQYKKPLYISNMLEPGPEYSQFPLLPYLKHTGACCYIVAPLFHNTELIGMMEASSPNAGVLDTEILKKLEPVYTFFEMACRNNITQFRNEIESLVKEQFTSLQPIVEWKFLEEAWAYLKEKEKKANPEMGVVRFDKVYPVYGAIDIRNSSTERNRCIQADLLEHLERIDEAISRMIGCENETIREYLQSLKEKNESFREKTSGHLLAEDEAKVNEYLENEVKTFFRHLSHSSEGIAGIASHFLETVDPQRGTMFGHRRRFDDSIGTLNNVISNHLESEQVKIEKVYPHYFEKFRTDGVEFNIYIGESLTPNRSFDYIYLKNIRFWQLITMAEITRLTAQIEPRLPLPLQTTQLILVYGSPICIGFRSDERRFDVDGAESIRFEILKKRLDKVKIKETGERLTQPGTISIVYTHAKEAAEYEEYLHFIQQKNLMTGEKEMLELEDVQGISGLKAIRVMVNVS
jgi:hypothetical protein